MQIDTLARHLLVTTLPISLFAGALNSRCKFILLEGNNEAERHHG